MEIFDSVEVQYSLPHGQASLDCLNSTSWWKELQSHDAKMQADTEKCEELWTILQKERLWQELKYNVHFPQNMIFYYKITITLYLHPPFTYNCFTSYYLLSLDTSFTCTSQVRRPQKLKRIQKREILHLAHKKTPQRLDLLCVGGGLLDKSMKGKRTWSYLCKMRRYGWIILYMLSEWPILIHSTISFFHRNFTQIREKGSQRNGV